MSSTDVLSSPKIALATPLLFARHAGDERQVGRRLLPGAVHVQVVFETGPHVAAHRHRQRVHRPLRASDSGSLPVRPGREPPHQHREVLGRRRQRPERSEQDVEDERRHEDAAIDQVVRVVQHARIEHLEFGDDAAIAHGEGELPDHLRFVHRGLAREVQRAERQRGEVRLQVALEVQDCGPLVEAAVHAAARGHADDGFRHDGPDVTDDVRVALERGGRLTFDVPGMEVKVGRASLDAQRGVRSDLVGLFGNGREVASPGHHTGQGRVDDQGRGVVWQISHASKRISKRTVKSRYA